MSIKAIIALVAISMALAYCTLPCDNCVTTVHPIRMQT